MLLVCFFGGFWRGALQLHFICQHQALQEHTGTDGPGLFFPSEQTQTHSGKQLLQGHAVEQSTDLPPKFHQLSKPVLQ